MALLGPPQITTAGAPLHVDTRKAVALLAYLATEGPQRRATLAGVLWPDSDASRARSALRRTLSVLRQGTHEVGVEVDGETVALAPDDTWSDVAEVDHALERVRSHARDHAGAGCPGCTTALAGAADLHRGTFIDGFVLRDSDRFEDWADAQRARRHLLHAEVLERLVRLLTADGAFDEAARRTHERLSLDPLHERSYQHLMLLYAWTDRRSEAIAQYRRCVAVLDRELGVAPLGDTTALYERILSDTAPPPPPVGAGTSMSVPGPGVGHGDRGTDPTARTSPDRAVAELPMVGRADELARLLAAYEHADESGRAVFVTGEAGIGKTRLADEVRAAVADTGGATVVVTCHEGESNLPFAAVAEALRAAAGRTDRSTDIADHVRAEVGRLVPELPGATDPAALPVLDSPGARARFLDAVCAFLDLSLAPAGASPGLLVVDDLQWADASSLEALGYLIRRLARRRLLVVLAGRAGEGGARGRPSTVLRAVENAAGGAVIELGRLTTEDVEDLVALAAPDNLDLAPRLYDETEGVPFLLAEYLPELPTSDAPWDLPESARHHVDRRIGSLPDLDRQVLTAAAVIGRSFDLGTLIAASGRSPDEVSTAIDDLISRRFVRIAGASLEFAHDKVRVAVYEGLGPGRRRLLHGRVGDALYRSARTEAELDARAVVVATHLERAGNSAEASGLHRRAAAHARRLAAHTEALSHLRLAHALAPQEDPGLREEMGDVLVQLGNYSGAVDALEAAASHTSDGESLARLEQKLAGVHLRRGDRATADAHLRVALELLGDDASTAARSRVQSDRALGALRANETGEAAALAAEALYLAQATDDLGALAQAQNLVGMVARRRNDIDAAHAAIRRSLELAAELGDEPMQVAALNNLALVLRTEGRLDESRELLEGALRRCRAYGDRHREAALLNNLADVEYDRGDREGAMQHLKAAVALFAEVGEPQRHEPEIWKLIDW